MNAVQHKFPYDILHKHMFIIYVLNEKDKKKQNICIQTQHNQSQMINAMVVFFVTQQHYKSRLKSSIYIAAAK